MKSSRYLLRSPLSYTVYVSMKEMFQNLLNRLQYHAPSRESLTFVLCLQPRDCFPPIRLCESLSVTFLRASSSTTIGVREPTNCHVFTPTRKNSMSGTQISRLCAASSSTSKRPEQSDKAIRKAADVICILEDRVGEYEVGTSTALELGS